MSLILDALRKMEEERKVRHGGNVDIRPAVLGHSRVEKGRRSSKKQLILAAAGVAILAAGVGGGVLLTENQQQRVPEQAPAAARSEVPAKESPHATVTFPATGSPSGLDKPHLIRQQAVVTRTAAPRANPTQATAPVPTAAQLPAVAEQPEPGEYPGAGLTVSGIAWQEERSLRRAVVNGNLVGEGAEVAGARIVEIGERRVKFSQGGRTISVSLSSPFQGR